MIGVNVDSLPYQRKIDYRYIKYIRLCRNITQGQFGEICRLDRSVLAKLERGDIQLTPHYETKIMDGVKALNISLYELEAIQRLLAHKENK